MKELNINDLTLEQKIGQLLCVRGFIDEKDEAFVMEMVKKKAVGAIQMGYFEGCREKIAEINELAGYPILICANMEYGYAGTKLKYPAQMALSATNDPKLAYEAARVSAIEAKADGFNVMWAPVVDLCSEGKLCKNTRTFSDDTDTTTEFGCAVIKAYQDEGMISTAKHFPSPCDGKNDSHFVHNDSQHTEEELYTKNMVPYIEAIKRCGLTGIMTSHTVFEKIDPGVPATFSKKILSMIRKAGFDGVIMSDSLAMMSVVRLYGDLDSIWMAIEAGNDMVLPNYRLTFKESYEYLLESYKQGKFSEERLNDAVQHVLNAQKFTLKKASSGHLTDEHINTIEELNKRSLCFVGRDGFTAKIDDNKKKLFVLFSENFYPYDSSINEELEAKEFYFYKNVLLHKEQILKEYPDAEVVIISDYPNHVQNEKVLVAAQKAEEIIFCTFCRPQSYQGSDGINERACYLINCFHEKTVSVLHTGNPYEVQKFPVAKRIFLGHLGGDSLKYTLKAMKGEFTPSGKIPVKVNL